MNETIHYGLYQMQNDGIMDTAPTWRLMRIRLSGEVPEDGIHPMDNGCTYTGLAEELPAEFESGFIVLRNTLPGTVTIFHAADTLSLQAEAISSALKTDNIVVYSAKESGAIA